MAREIRRMREMEELIGLQDRAIQALQQATVALNLALQALQRSMDEKGQQNHFTFEPQYIPKLPILPIPSGPLYGYGGTIPSPYSGIQPMVGSTVYIDSPTNAPKVPND
jgi:hypothetical protein